MQEHDVERLRRELEEARAAEGRMREFVATAAHELRGPMAAIMGFAQTMVRRWDEIAEDDKREYLTIIVRRSRYLTRLLDGLLTLSKIEAGALEVHPQQVVVTAVIEQAIEDLGEGDLPVDISVPEDVEVVADPDHVRRILSNYLSNALKYGAPPVHVNARRVDDAVEVTVCDHGDGVPDDLAERLFDRFTRAQNVDGDKGTGLGLSIVRGLARANGGDAWHRPNRPSGSCFGVRLPAAS